MHITVQSLFFHWIYFINVYIPRHPSKVSVCLSLCATLTLTLSNSLQHAKKSNYQMIVIVSRSPVFRYTLIMMIQRCRTPTNACTSPPLQREALHTPCSLSIMDQGPLSDL